MKGTCVSRANAIVSNPRLIGILTDAPGIRIAGSATHHNSEQASKAAPAQDHLDDKTWLCLGQGRRMEADLAITATKLPCLWNWSCHSAFIVI